MWFDILSDFSDSDDKEGIEFVASQMTDEQILIAEKLIKQCVSKKYNYPPLYLLK